MPFTPSPVVVILAGVLVTGFALVATLILWLVERRARARRVSTAVGKRSNRNAQVGSLRPAGSTVLREAVLSFMRAATDRVSIMKGRQIREIRTTLITAGYRGRDAIVVFTFFKLVAPLVFLLGAALYVYELDPIGKGPWLDVAAILAAALVGGKLPDAILQRRREQRLDSIKKALPDTLDMLVICAEAGLSSDAALKRVVIETGRGGSILAEELNQTVMELSFMPQRRIALDNLSERAPIPPINAFVNTMIQAEKYGTPLARAYKVLSQEQRTERMLRAEEKAGRLPATMTVPMMIFILPALFIVLIGPAVLDIMDNFVGMK